MNNTVSRKEFTMLNIIITSIAIALALFAWRINSRHQENIMNVSKICDRFGIEYSISTNHIGLRNNIILK